MVPLGTILFGTAAFGIIALGAASHAAALFCKKFGAISGIAGTPPPKFGIPTGAPQPA